MTYSKVSCHWERLIKASRWAIEMLGFIEARTFTDTLGVTIREEEFDVSVVETVVSEEVIYRSNSVELVRSWRPPVDTQTINIRSHDVQTT